MIKNYRKFIWLGILIGFVIGLLLYKSNLQILIYSYFTEHIIPLLNKFKNTPILIATLTSIVSAFLGLYVSRRYYSSKNKIQLSEAIDIDATKLKAILRNIDEDEFKSYEQAKKIKEKKERIDYEDNLSKFFLIKRFCLNNVSFFISCEWNFRPGINLLLGRNGYGKSYLLQTLSALLQRDDEKSKDLLVDNDSTLIIDILRDGQNKTILRGYDQYQQSVGKIPILAIPDSRFIDRSKKMFSPTENSYDDLKEYGAYHFLHKLPYTDIINSFLYGICLDYWENGKNFNKPIFNFIKDIIYELSGENFEFVSIDRVGREKFEIYVITEGSETPLPIQKASQGTLSIVSLFGLIWTFLKSLSGNEKEPNKQSALVIIDEVDAHLHPTWVQKLTTLMRNAFPRVQFILTAHNPLMAAGCLENEVVVLRKKEKKFYLDQIERDFVGSTAKEIYSDLFDIYETDRNITKYHSLKKTNSESLDKLRQLDLKADNEEIGAVEWLDREQLIRQQRLTQKLSDSIKFNSDENLRILKLEAEIARLKDGDGS